MWLDDLRPFRPAAADPLPCATEDAYRAFGLASGVVREEVPAGLPFGRLRLFCRQDAPDAPARTVLVVAPIAGGYPFLMRDLVAALLPAAGRVGITEWPNARYLPAGAGRFGFAENCLETAQMARALAVTGPVHLVGVCQGALPAFAAACLLAEEGVPVASLSLVGGPMDPARNPTRLWKMLQERSLEALEAQVMEDVPQGLPGAGRRVFPAWRQIDTFALYLWRQSISGGDLPMRLLFDEGDDPLRFPLSRLCWTMMDVPDEFFMENVSTIFRDNALAKGTLEIGGHRVRAEALRGVLLTVEGAQDDISAPGQTEAAHDFCRAVPEALRRRVSVADCGHFGLFYGRRMRATVIPALVEAMEAGERAL
ncbi:polyhydroxyalkanoate depolymerase [Xanthobacter flavus]|uniref:polyhydroxyalkanoate depolymerase n=1 Tax=Xanthobacter flavus TaxID=281 RepID=UPI001AE4F2C8|nr:polyhydroxyalkanoate depolymerase [Xanthobacter flavus]MBP2149205.1 poly(3-hydroxybutyrate) depolymerase [Xanthobacter flavus]